MTSAGLLRRPVVLNLREWLSSYVNMEGKNGSQITPAHIVGHIRYCVGAGGGAPWVENH